MIKVIYGFLYLTLCFSSISEARQVRIVVIDSGLNQTAVPDAKICLGGIVDFTGTSTKDELNHGTNIAGIIAKELKNYDYCMYIFKVYTNTNKRDTAQKYFGYLMALIMTSHIHPDLVNFSSSGLQQDQPEKYLIQALTDDGITFVTAAGNGGINLDSNCNAFPACYAGVISVGNLNKNLTPHYSSNFGKHVSAWAVGTDITAGGVTMTGTSQSTAFVTALIAKKLAKEK